MAALRHLRLVLQYEGTDYCGYQRQAGQPTIQEALEDKLSAICGEPIATVAAGRTDSGVHASGQVVALRTRGRIPTERLAPAFNGRPPHALAIRHVQETTEDFHPQRDALERTYQYHIWREQPTPFLRRYVLFQPEMTDAGVARMAAAVPALRGEHDFATFCAVDHEASSTVRRVYRVEIRSRGQLVSLEITGSGFLRRMVRSLMGSLLEIARGREEPESLGAALAARDRDRAGPTAPPQGLFLTRVTYPDGYPPPTPAPLSSLLGSGCRQ